MRTPAKGKVAKIRSIFEKPAVSKFKSAMEKPSKKKMAARGSQEEGQRKRANQMGSVQVANAGGWIQQEGGGTGEGEGEWWRAVWPQLSARSPTSPTPT